MWKSDDIILYFWQTCIKFSLKFLGHKGKNHETSIQKSWRFTSNLMLILHLERFHLIFLWKFVFSNQIHFKILILFSLQKVSVRQKIKNGFFDFILSLKVTSTITITLPTSLPKTETMKIWSQRPSGENETIFRPNCWVLNWWFTTNTLNVVWQRANMSLF